MSATRPSPGQKDLPFSCRCGAVTGSLENVGPKSGDRYVCYCRDCRDAVRHLAHEEDVLDPAGGVSVYQTRVGKLRLESGKDRLACLNLTEKQTLRWYCGDCGTPLFTTMDTARWPFLSMVTAGCDPAMREEILGSPRGSVFAAQATGPHVVTPPVSTFAMIRRVIARLFADKFSGAGKRYPLFDPATLEPIVTPRILTAQEKEALGRA